MKQLKNMTDLFDRLNDLKIAFSYGEKYIPIIQSIIDFMKETVPLLENINSSISDTTNKIPKAKDQINNVSNATELATTEILDIVDSISLEIEKVENDAKAILTKEEEKRKIWVQIKEILKKNPESENLVQKYEEYHSVQPEIQKILEVFNKTRNDVNNIALSLQVQDITSQQLAAVNHLIESVREKLTSLILHLNESEGKEVDLVKISAPAGAAFDPDAEYTKSKEKQDVADVLVNNNYTKTSQDEIDKLFS